MLFALILFLQLIFVYYLIVSSINFWDEDVPNDGSARLHRYTSARVVSNHWNWIFTRRAFEGGQKKMFFIVFLLLYCCLRCQMIFLSEKCQKPERDREKSVRKIAPRVKSEFLFTIFLPLFTVSCQLVVKCAIAFCNHDRMHL